MTARPDNPFTATLDAINAALGAGATLPAVRQLGHGALPSIFPVTDLAAATVAAAGRELAAHIMLSGRPAPQVTVDRRLASFRFATSFRPEGWEPPSPWDPVAGDYQTADGWIRLHTNAPHHRAAALGVLGVEADRQAVAAAVRRWRADELETAVVEAGGCAASMRSLAAWQAHPQGAAVNAEPLVHVEEGTANDRSEPAIRPERPLAGIRVLDLTRVLAGPVASRFLAGFGADVLRIDPPGWDEPGVLPDVTPGKRRARLDLRQKDDRLIFEKLLAEADILVHGYRGEALEHLGFGAEWRKHVRPGLIDVSLDAYGWTGPWRGRRGFDSLVQMSAGIAEAGMRLYGTDRPRPLPVQALDHATGYLMAACALRGLNERRAKGRGSRWRTSLARMAALLTSLPQATDTAPFDPVGDADYLPVIEQSGWGPLHRLKPPLSIEGAEKHFSRPAGPLGSDAASW